MDKFTLHYLKESYKAEYGSLEGFNLWTRSPLSAKEYQSALRNADDARAYFNQMELRKGTKRLKEVILCKK
uniref:Uncharacterized protein n=1 Tax=viral metagenome TaxID=1070528 RepID=A0A6M3M0P0_9ZZZZ